VCELHSVLERGGHKQHESRYQVLRLGLDNLHRQNGKKESLG